jgi:hypothetical protein
METHLEKGDVFFRSYKNKIYYCYKTYYTNYFLTKVLPAEFICEVDGDKLKISSKKVPYDIIMLFFKNEYYNMSLKVDKPTLFSNKKMSYKINLKNFLNRLNPYYDYKKDNFIFDVVNFNTDSKVNINNFINSIDDEILKKYYIDSYDDYCNWNGNRYPYPEIKYHENADHIRIETKIESTMKKLNLEYITKKYNGRTLIYEEFRRELLLNNYKRYETSNIYFINKIPIKKLEIHTFNKPIDYNNPIHETDYHIIFDIDLKKYDEFLDIMIELYSITILSELPTEIMNYILELHSMLS